MWQECGERFPIRGQLRVDFTITAGMLNRRAIFVRV